MRSAGTSDHSVFFVVEAGFLPGPGERQSHRPVISASAAKILRMRFITLDIVVIGFLMTETSELIVRNMANHSI